MNGNILFFFHSNFSVHGFVRFITFPGLLDDENMKTRVKMRNEVFMIYDVMIFLKVTVNGHKNKRNRVLSQFPVCLFVSF